MSRTSQQMTQQLRDAAALGPAQNYLIQSFFDYTLYFPSVASLATSTAQMNVQADADFLIQSISFTAIDDVTFAQVSAPVCTVQLTDSGSGANLFDRAIPLLNFAGTAQLPFILPVPRLLSKNSTLTGTLTNNTVTNAITYYITFHGQKLYR